MRIAVIGSQGQGKSTFIDDFLKVWPMYTKSEGKYRKAIKEQNLTINQEGTQENQQIIMDAIIDEMMLYPKNTNVIHDRCSIDNLVYSMWLYEKNKGNIDDKFIEKSLKLTHISLAFLDLVIFLPKLEKYQIKLEEKETRDIDPVYADEINNLYLAIQDSYNKSQNTVFPFETIEGSPALIEIFGTPQERIQMVKLYLDDTGEPFGKKTSDSLIQLPSLEEQAYIDKIIEQNLPDKKPNQIPLIK